MGCSERAKRQPGPYRSVGPSASAQKALKVNEKKQNKTQGSISSRTAVRKTLLAQQDPFRACPWSLHFSGLLHTTYRPQGQLAKHRAPAESERETSSRNSLVT